MATSSLRFAFSPLIHTQISSKISFSSPNFQSKSIRILCFSSSIPATATALETLAPLALSQSVNTTTENKWEPYRKKKVVMRIGYVGTDYRGLQMQKDESISISSSDFDTESTGSFFHDRSITLGALMGVPTSFPAITFRTPPLQQDGSPAVTCGPTVNHTNVAGRRKQMNIPNIIPLITELFVGSGAVIGRGRSDVDTITGLMVERRRKRFRRRRNWWWFCSGEASKPYSFGELLEVERQFGAETVFSDALTDANFSDHNRNGGRMLFADGRVLPPAPLVSDVNEGSLCICSVCRFPALLAAICGGGGGGGGGVGVR